MEILGMLVTMAVLLFIIDYLGSLVQRVYI